MNQPLKRSLYLAALIEAARRYVNDQTGDDAPAGLDQMREALDHFDAAPLSFNPERVVIERHRVSTTQGSVSVSYDGWHIARFGDTFALRDGKEWAGLPDSLWIETARRWFEGEISPAVLRSWEAARAIA